MNIKRVLATSGNTFNNWLFTQRISASSRNTGSTMAASFPKSRRRSTAPRSSIVRVNDEKRDHGFRCRSHPALPRRARCAACCRPSGGEIDKVLRGERKAVLLTFLVAALVTMPALGARSPVTLPSRSGGLSAAAERVSARRQQPRRDSRFHLSARRDRPSVGLAARHDRRLSTTASTPSRPLPPMCP